MKNKYKYCSQQLLLFLVFATPQNNTQPLHTVYKYCSQQLQLFLVFATALNNSPTCNKITLSAASQLLEYSIVYCSQLLQLFFNTRQKNVIL